MKKGFLLITILILVSCKAFAQTNTNQKVTKKEITLEKIWNGTFSPERMNSLNSMNGDFYSLLNSDRETKSVTEDKYS